MQADCLAIRRGDEKVYRDLIAAHSRRVYAYAHRFAKSGDEEDDLAAETWAIAWELRDTYLGRGEYVAWLMRICRTVCSRASRASREDDALGEAEAPPVQTVNEALARQLLEDMRLDLMMALPPRQRLCVILRVIRQMSTKDTAKLMRCRPGTVKATLFAGLRALRSPMYALRAPPD